MKQHHHTDTSVKRYITKQHNGPVERICRTLELRDNPELIAEYRRRHSREGIWPEVPAGLARLPRQQEWEDYMAIFQTVKPGATAAEKWQPMERIFHLYE